MRTAQKIAGWVVTALLGATLFALGQRPDRSPREETVFPGAHYVRFLWEDALVHLVTLDLRQVRPQVTAPEDSAFVARNVREHAVREDLAIAINANYFYPFHSHGPWDFEPQAGQDAFAVGGVISRGRWVSDMDPEFPMLCFEPEASIRPRCSAGASEGVAGKPLLVRGGTVQPLREDEPQPRTAVGITSRGELLLVVVDGRQPGYSAGLTLRDLARLLVERRAVDALNLDGGGSSTLVIRQRVMNAPIHTRLPMRQRPVPVVLGFVRSG